MLGRALVVDFMATLIIVSYFYIDVLPIIKYMSTGCWIRPEFKTERIVCQYLWMWAAGGIMVVLYGLIAIVMRGIIVIEDGIHLAKNRSHVNLNSTATDAEEDRASKAIANLMFL